MRALRDRGHPCTDQRRNFGVAGLFGYIGRRRATS
jgi:hypothetical protein